MIIDELFEGPQQCPECGGISFSDLILAEKKDACYHKVKASAKVWPSAYASGRLVQCRKKGAANYGNKSESLAEVSKDTLDRYVTKAVDAHGHADFSARQSKDDPSLRSYHVDQKKTAKKRRQGISRALDRMSKEQGVAESMDPDQQGRLNELIDDYNLSMKERSYWEADSILDKITREFGKDIADQVDQQGVAEAEKNPHTSALGRALYRDLSKEKKASPQQVQRNKERWAKRQADKEQGMAEGMWDRLTTIPELERAIENLIMGYKGGINLTDKGRAQLLLSINKGKRILAKKKQQQDMAEGVLDEAVGMIIKGAAISGPDDQDIADRIAARTGGRVDSGSRGHHILIIYPTTQHRAMAAAKIRKMFPGIELYKSGGNRNAIDEQGIAEGGNVFMPNIQNTPEYKAGFATGKLPVPHPEGTQQYANYYKGVIDKASPTLSKVGEGEQQKGADYRDPKEVDYDDEYDAMVARVKKLAGLGPMKTVYDPTKRVYRNMPTAVQPKK